MEKLINEMLADRGMSLAELTELLGYQSKTSLVRVMKNQASQRALDTFAKKVNENLRLSEAEQVRLLDAMECVRWQEDYASSREMLKFLRGAKSADGEVLLEDVASGAKESFAGRYSDASEIRITLLNSQYVLIYPELLRLVRQKGATVEHFLQMREHSTCVIHAINALIPLIYERGYSGYSYKRPAHDECRSSQGMLCADVMVVRYLDGDKIPREDMIVFDGDEHGFLQTTGAVGSFERMLGVCRENYEPLKHVYFQQGGMEGYVRFCSDYARLEHNRSVYKIKPDIGLEWIPEDILVASLMESGMFDFSRIQGMFDQFTEVYRERVRNAYEKRRVTKVIFKRSAMVRFARTGRLQDHFWAMRPFTSEERVRILALLLEHMDGNPYFDIYFLKDNDFLRDAEIAWYEGAGIMIMDANTDYALEGNHSEVMIVHEEFMRIFKEYFERSLLADRVVSRNDSVNFMNELIRIAMSEA